MREWIARAPLVFAGAAAAVAGVALLLVLIVGALWLLYDDPEPTNPAAMIELKDGRESRVQQCLRAADTHVGRVWICSFFRISPALRNELRSEEARRDENDANTTRLACFLENPGGESDGPIAVGFAEPDRLTNAQRCREEIEWARRLPRS